MTTTDRAMPVMADLRRLAGESGASVSILLGPHRAGSGTRPAAVRLRALLHEAEATLEARGKNEADRRALLDPLMEMLEDPEFAGGHHQSFALFRNARMSVQYRLPWEAEDGVRVEGRFALTELAAQMGVAREFLLLALSRKRVRLFECDEHDCTERALPGDVPDNLEEFLALDLSEFKLKGRSPGGRTFGLGTERDKADRYFHDYCVAIGRGVTGLLRERPGPLVVAGATEEVAGWRAANPEIGMYAGDVETSPDGGQSDRELAAKARAVLAKWRSPEQVHAMELYERQSGSERVERDVRRIVKAAASGRVEHLFFAPGASQTGDYDRIVGRVRMTGEYVSSADDLINAAVADTLRNSGHVWSGVPEGLPMAAVLRY